MKITDKMRLDFLHRGHMGVDNTLQGKLQWFVWPNPAMKAIRRSSPRAAIDSAIRAERRRNRA